MAATSANIYCIGVFKKDDIMYFPELEIDGVTPTTDSVDISIKGASPDSTITLTYSTSTGNLLNNSPSNTISKEIKPEKKDITGSDEKLKTFFEKLDDNYLPFCLAIQFYVADDSTETGPKSVSDLMKNSSVSTDSNRKGDLMCDLYHNIFVGHDVNTRYSCFTKANSIEIIKGAPIPLKNGSGASGGPAAGSAAGSKIVAVPGAPPSGGGSGPAAAVILAVSPAALPGGSAAGSAAGSKIVAVPAVPAVPSGGGTTTSHPVSTVPAAHPVSTAPAVPAVPSGGSVAVPHSGSKIVAVSVVPSGGGLTTAHPVSTASLSKIAAVSKSTGGTTSEIEYHIFDDKMLDTQTKEKILILNGIVYVEMRDYFGTYKYYGKKPFESIKIGDDKINLTDVYDSTNEPTIKISDLKKKFLWITQDDYKKYDESNIRTKSSKTTIKGFVKFGDAKVYIHGDKKYFRECTKDSCGLYVLKDDVSNEGKFNSNVTAKIKFYEIKGLNDEMLFNSNVVEKLYKDPKYKNKSVFKSYQLVKKKNILKDDYYYLFKIEYDEDGAHKIDYFVQKIGSSEPFNKKEIKDFEELYIINPTTYVFHKLGQEQHKIRAKGGGLKRNVAVQTAIPRIYVNKTAERRTDYYNYT